MTAVLNDDMQLFKQFTDNEGFRQPQASIAFLEIDDIGAFLERDDVSGADWKHPPADIVRELEPENVETFFPRCGPGYAELTIPRRQKGEAGADMLLASYFSGRPLDPGADAVFDETEEVMDRHLRRVRWNHPQELQEKLVEALVEALGLAGPDDEMGFEESLGGARHDA